MYGGTGKATTDSEGVVGILNLFGLIHKHSDECVVRHSDECNDMLQL